VRLSDRLLELREIEIREMILEWRRDPLLITRDRRRRITLEIIESVIDIGKDALSEWGRGSSDDAAFNRLAMFFEDHLDRRAEEMWHKVMADVALETGEAEYARWLMSETIRDSFPAIVERIFLDRIKGGIEHLSDAGAAEARARSAPLIGKQAPGARTPTTSAPPVARNAVRDASPIRETDIDRTKTMIIELQRERLTFLQIADSLAKAPRQLKAEWKDVPEDYEKGQTRKADPSLLRDNEAVNFRIAEQYLGVSERQRQKLVRKGALVVVGGGKNRKITTESLRKYLPAINTPN